MRRLAMSPLLRTPTRGVATHAQPNISMQAPAWQKWAKSPGGFRGCVPFFLRPGFVLSTLGAYTLWGYTFQRDPSPTGWSWQRELARDNELRKLARAHEFALEKMRLEHKSGSPGVAEELLKLHELHDQSVLTKPELDAAKAKVLQIT